jgi:hypothetical protein
VSGATATWVATGSWNGIAGYQITVTVEDSGAPKKASPDTIQFVIHAPNGTIVFSTSGPLVGGNIVIH